MGSLSTETRNMEEHELDQIQSSGRTQAARWTLESPDPPSLVEELLGSIKDTVLPRRKYKASSSPKNKYAPALSFFQGLFPSLRWGRNYKAAKFKHDLMAGLTLASLSIPQSIGYAGLAKLDPQYGLYTSVVPPLIYAFMGSSREIAIGPVAVVSMLLASMVQQIIDPIADPIGYTNFVLTATFFAGIFQAVFGLFRLGFLVDFLSHAAIVGFMGGAAIVIGLQQLKGLLGMSHFTTKTDVVSVFSSVFHTIIHDPWSPLNAVLGCSFLIFILAMRFISRRNKKLFWLQAIAPLISVIVATAIVFLTRADQHGVKIVKHLHSGLNPISAHQLQFKDHHVGQAAKVGLIAAIVALTEAIAVGRSFASIRGYHLDGNKEMVAMGSMNIIGSLTSCYVATGSFSRTAVNFSAGCETAVSNIVMAITVLISLELFTRLLYYTPMAILASIILSALPGLIDINEALHIWKVDKLDFLACVGAFLGVLFASVEIGLLVAVTISFAKILLNSIRSGIEVEGILPGTHIFGDTKQYPMALETPGISIIRISSPLLCFANANSIRERVMRQVTEEEEGDKENTSKNKRIQVVILDMSGLMSIDTAGIIALEELHKNLALVGIELAMANPRWQVIHKMKVAKFIEKIGRKWIFATVGEAVDACIHTKAVGFGNC